MFRLFLVTTLIMFGFSTNAQQLTVGDKAPSFTLLDQNGTTVSSADLYGKEILVIYFYPKDDTPGCTKEACSFRDNFTAFTEAGVRVLGVSADSPASHKAFAEKYKLPFTLLSDPNNALRDAFGVKGDLFGLIPGRLTFVIDTKGIIQHVFISQTQAEKHIKESLDAIAKLKGA